jgi:hypothetical protein
MQLAVSCRLVVDSQRERLGGYGRLATDLVIDGRFRDNVELVEYQCSTPEGDEL